MSKKVGFWEFFQGLGKTFMLPVSLLAACGIMLGIGSSFASSVTAEVLPFLKVPVIKLFFEFMSTIGSFAFSNLPIMFAMAIPLGLARQDKGVAAFSGYVGFVMSSMTANFFLKVTGTLATPENMKAAGQAMVFGIQSVDIGVLGGVIIGIIVYKIHDKFCEIKLPDALAFFGGARFVPIATAVIVGIVGLVIPLIWPFFNGIIIKIGELIGKAGVFGPLLFGAGEGVLRPFGLHHILVAMIRFTSAGGEAIINGEPVYGALNIFYKEFANGILDPNVTRFLSQGKMPSYMFGLPAVALAIYHTARPENRKKVKGLLASGIVACVIGGITEPLEFIFLFLSPVLYLFHCIMVGLGFMTMGILKVATVGPKLKTHSGKQIEELPCLADVCVREYVARQMIYPVELLKDNVSGYALCEFTIDKEGVILRPHILKSTHPEFAEEALRIVKEMPNWTPALVGGKAVESDYTLYVPFRPQLYKEQLQIRERELSKKH